VSVLLDALKKAAEEKKKVDSLTTADEQEYQADVPTSNFTLTGEAARADGSFTDKVEALPSSDDFNESMDSSNVVTSESMDSESESTLPTFSLKTEFTDTTEQNAVQELAIAHEEITSQLDSSDSTSLKLEEPVDNDYELSSLIDSLDIDESDIKGDLTLNSSSPLTLDNGLQLEQQVQPSFEPISTEDISVDSLDEKQSKAVDSDFSWSMDELPAYQSSEKPTQNPQVFSSENAQNPILLNGGSSAPVSPLKKKYATSSRLIVSLFVILLFIGIGFYGMVYYQEQNDDLEYSMRKYNLTQMRFEPSSTKQASNYDVTNSSEDENTNVTVAQSSILTLRVESAHSNNSTNSPDSNVDVSNQVPIQDNHPKVVQTSVVKKTTTSPVNNRTEHATSDKLYQSLQNNKVSTQPVTKPPVKQSLKSKSSGVNDPIIVMSTAKSHNTKAYEAYSAGDFNKASALFQQAIKSESSNKTALIGLGGVAVAMGDLYKAVSFYQQVLNIEPTNLHAYEAIANLSGRVPLNKDWESELLVMSNKYPKSAVMQYALGNVYAKEKDWLAAQQRYFNAYALDSANPDYMVNLAVSFDHLGKYVLADQYYTQALGYSAKNSVSFDREEVKNRLISVRQFIVKGQ